MKKKNLLLTFLITLSFILIGGGDLMGQMTLPYSYGFESEDVGTWEKINCNSFSAIGTSYPHNSSKRSFAFACGGSTASQYQYLVSPKLQTTTSNLYVTFYIKNTTNNSTAKYTIGYSTKADVNDSSDFTYIEDEISISPKTDYTLVGIEVPYPNIQHIAIRFNRELCVNYDYSYLDDITISIAISCSTPTNLSATPTSTTANVTWTAGGSEEEWLLYYSTSSTAPADDLYSGEGVVTGIDETLYTLEDLAPGTTYFIYVRAKCGENEYSDWTSAESFTTLCTPEAIPYSYGFEDADELNCWTIRNAYSSTGIVDEGYNSSHSFKFHYSVGYGTQYLISPELSGTSCGVHVQLYHKQSAQGATLQIGYSTTNNATGSFTWETGTENKAFANFTSYEYICPPSTKYVAIRYSATTYTNIFIDDIAFTKAYDKVSNGEYWYNTTDWNPVEVPSAEDNVYINNAMTIPNACAAVANNITLGPSGSLTIEDGGQLICNNNPTVTMQKSITGYGEGNDKWYFIASPITNDITPDPEGIMLSNVYDLYRLNNTTWENYRAHTEGFTITNGNGYLYANSENVTLEFTGTIKPYDADYEISITEGWNLVGNPYTFNAYVNTPYYAMKGDGSGITAETVSTSTAVKPCTGIVINAGNDGYIKFLNEEPVASANNGNLQMVLAQNVATRGERTAQTLDKAIVSFNEGSQLGKFYFGTQDANLYIPQNNEEYAIVSSSAQGEMPVNFKAHRDGQYTITVNPEEVEMGYLHLIDNIAGKEVDLLANPSYTFNAKADDYESRFRLVFSANMVNADLNDDFAFFSNGQLVIANEGEAILQVIDVTGRTVVTESINGTCGKAVNVKAGVYVLRLINGTNVKTQKIIVK